MPPGWCPEGDSDLPPFFLDESVKRRADTVMSEGLDIDDEEVEDDWSSVWSTKLRPSDEWSDDAFGDADMDKFGELSKIIIEMGLIDIWRDMIMDTLIAKMEEVVARECADNFDKKIMDRLLRWMVVGPLLWLRTALGLPRQMPLEGIEEGSVEIEWWNLVQLLIQELIVIFQNVRMSEGFDMIRDFPDSSPGLRDLRTCLMLRPKTREMCVRQIRQQFAKRLLIPGANTKSVIAVYIKTIKAMRLVDPRGVLLEAISPPIKNYLKSRKDTIRCIVTALTEDSDLQLEFGDLSKGKKGYVDFDFDSDDSYDSDPENWEPEPIDAEKPIRKGQDIIIMLIGIYGSKEMFIKEYREMLAERLLNSATYATEKEARNLELLKTRFGEQSLGQCEVMLQDLKDSKRLNTNIQNRRGKAAAIEKNLCPTATTPTAGNMASSPGGPLTPPFVQNFSPFGQGQQTPAAAAASSSNGIIFSSFNLCLRHFEL